MKILITGSNGRIGQKLSVNLSKEYDLVLTSREANSQLIRLPNSKYYKLDITDSASICNIISREKPEVIIHLAGIMGKTCEENHDLAYRINVEATKNLAQCAAENNVKKFIFSSSAAVYPQNLNRPLKEEDADPQSYYGKIKLEAEEELRKISTESDLNVIVFRIFNIYGEHFSDSLIVRLILSARKNEPEVLLTSPEDFFRDYIYIDDVLTAFKKSIVRKFNDSFNVYNIATGLPISTKELMKIILSKGISPKVKILKLNRKNSYVYADIKKASCDLDFTATTSINEFLKLLFRSDHSLD